MLVGEPLLTQDGPTAEERDAQLEYLHTKWDDGNFKPLRNASGTFCAVHYDPRTHAAHLIGDRLGLRPLYYTVLEEFVYFSSALRIFEALQEVPKKMDVVSVVETTGFGYPFGAGTPYAGIKMVQPCEIITIRYGDMKSSRYFSWDSIAPSKATAADALKEAFDRFRSSVRRRLRSDRTTFAYLSGGLDSRCVVAALRAEGVRVYTFNFSPPNTQDQVFGRQFGNRIGAIHHEISTGPVWDWSKTIADAWRMSPHRDEQAPERPKTAWSGEGGSVGLGHVYISPEIVSLMRSGDISGAIDVFLQQQKKRILTRILTPKLAHQFRSYLQLRLRSELDAIGHSDPLRTFYIFLNLNGPRRHLVRHFETIDELRTEFQMPFNDADFLEYITSLNVEPCLYHKFYVDWMSFFDPAVREVPWQAYPGHARSPVPIPADLPDQWNMENPKEQRQAVQRELLERSGAMLADPNFPRCVLRKSHLHLMRWAWRLKIGNYSYALKTALTYYHYWTMAGGDYDINRISDPEWNRAGPPQ
jgi:hypothetical protein